MHAAGITHGALTAEAVRVTDSGHEIAEWGSGAVVYRDLIRRWTSCTCCSRPRRRWASSERSQPQPTPWARTVWRRASATTAARLSARERRSAKGAGKQLKALRDEVARVTDTPSPNR